MAKTPTQAKKAAIKKAGGATVVASKCKVSVSAVSQWKAIPGPYLEKIFDLTEIPLNELRPDWFKHKWVVRQ